MGEVTALTLQNICQYYDNNIKEVINTHIKSPRKWYLILKYNT